MVFVSITPFNIFSAEPTKPVRPVRRDRPMKPTAPELPDTILLNEPVKLPAEVVEDEFTLDPATDSLKFVPVDSARIYNDAYEAPLFEEGLVADSLVAKGKKVFVPDPIRSVWLSALFPGLGQVYNRRYWKLPIIVGGYLGLAYATNWNSNMLRDYTRAYADLLDNDPNTRSYMDMFSPNVKEENLDRGWLQEVLRSRKNYFRRNRDLCIICMVGVYLLAMVDAYVDASLSHFDISPDLSMDVAPALIQDGRQRYPSVGLMWAVNF